MGSVAIKLDQATYDTFNELAEAKGMSVSDYLALVAMDGLRAHMIRETNSAYERLAGDPTAWADLQAERAVWDGALLDGLAES